MADLIRWGILGAAKFARQHMGPAIHAARDAQLFALATSDPDKAAPFQAIAPGLKIHNSYDALLADPEVDAVYVPLPNHLHVEWTQKALQAGKPVLTEKPVAMSASEIDGLIALRDQTQRLAAEAYMIVHHPQWQRTRALVRDGAIGSLIQVDGVFSYDNRSDPGNIRNKPETGGGSLPDIGVYTYGSARWVTGEEPEAITHANIRWENGVDVYAQIAARFPSFTYQAVTSMRMHPRQEMTFHGEKGVLRLSTPFNSGVFGQAELHLARGLSVETERWPGVNHYVNQVEAFGESLRDGIPYPWTLEDAKGTQSMIDRVFAAAHGE
ncbi:MAG: Gfo/Idh/MocA family oxidoreductase [Pseudomonadota bacterium]